MTVPTNLLALAEGGSPPVDPRLEDEHVPQLIAEVPSARSMKVPRPANGKRVKKFLGTETLLVEQMLGPGGELCT